VVSTSIRRSGGAGITALEMVYPRSRWLSVTLWTARAPSHAVRTSAFLPKAVAGPAGFGHTVSA